MYSGHVELDSLGIATLTLRVHHDSTAMEEHKRKHAKTKVAVDVLVVTKCCTRSGRSWSI